MEAFVLDQIIEDWNKAIYTVLHLEDLSLRRLQNLLKETYEALTAYHRETMVPKEMAAILLNMEDFLHFAAMMEENEKGPGYYYWEELFCLITEMKSGFLTGEYACAYPQIKVADCVDNEFLLDLEQDSLEWYITAFRRTKSIPN